jgi:hypothetical protein
MALMRVAKEDFGKVLVCQQSTVGIVSKIDRIYQVVITVPLFHVKQRQELLECDDPKK